MKIKAKNIRCGDIVKDAKLIGDYHVNSIYIPPEKLRLRNFLTGKVEYCDVICIGFTNSIGSHYSITYRLNNEIEVMRNKFSKVV